MGAVKPMEGFNTQSDLYTELLTYITPRNILLFLLLVLCAWFCIELYFIVSEKVQLKHWKPKPKNIHYKITTSSEKYQLNTTVLREKGQPDAYSIEYLNVKTGQIDKREVISAGQFADVGHYNSITHRESILWLYAISPDGRAIKCKMTRSNENNEAYTPYTEDDITEELLESAAGHLYRRAQEEPKRTDRISQKKYAAEIKAVKKLPVKRFEVSENGKTYNTVRLQKVQGKKKS